MNEDERCKEARRRVAIERLGSMNTACAVCGEDDPHCLERHHVAGQAFGDDCVPVCRNCHRKLSEAQKVHPAATEGESTWLEKVAYFLLGLADLLLFAAANLKKFASELIDRAHAESSTAGGPQPKEVP